MSVTGLYGRERELSDLARLLARPEVRVLTLVGPAGVGKTRLAEAAVGARRSAPVVRVDLAGMTEGADATGRVAAALEIRAGPGDPATEVERHVGDEPLLLFLDGCECCPELRGLLGRWLDRCPRLRALSTSRRPLHLAVEQVFPVPLLPLPDIDWNGDLATLAALPSIALLAERVRMVQPDWRIDGRNAGRVTAVCRGTDGLPLALELAAARLARTPRTGQGDSKDGRQHAVAAPSVELDPLETVIARGYELLSPAEQALLRRLAVFPGSWTTAAADEICGEPDQDTGPILAALVDSSLVVPTDHANGVPGYRLLRPIADFAGQRLAASGERRAIADRHSACFARLAREAERGAGTMDESAVMEWLDTEYADLSVAFQHARRVRDVDSVLALAAAMGWCCFTQGRVGDGSRVTGNALRMSGQRGSAQDRAACLLAAGILACVRGQYAQASAWAGEALSLSEALVDGRRCAIAHAFLGHTARLQGRFDSAGAHYRAAFAIQDGLDNDRGLAWARHDLGLLALEQGDGAKAANWLSGAAAWFDAAGDAWALAWTRLALGTNALRARRIAAALRLLGQALDTYTDLRDQRGVRECLIGFAEAAFVLGRYRETARLEGAAEAGRDKAAASRWLHTRSATEEKCRAAAVDAMGLAAYEVERQAGAAMRRVDVRNLALSITAAEPVQPQVLTPREQEVAALVATGAGNRQIGIRLGMAEKTVETHLTHIIAKLGVTNRTQVARHAAVKPIP